MKRKTLINYYEQFQKFEEKAVIEEDMLNLDILYECVSPPSDLNRKTSVNATTNFSKYIY